MRDSVISVQLDKQVLLWMCLPIAAITILASLLRQTLSAASQAGGGGGANPMPLKQSFNDIYASNVTMSSKKSRAAATLLTPSSLFARKRYYVGNDNDGKLGFPPPASEGGFGNVDPSSMGGAMKYNIVFLVLNGGLAYLISFLFSESIVAKTPFPLTRTFRSILQRGIEVKDLDSSYISALSWYFLVLISSGSLSHVIARVFGLVKLPSVSVMETLDPMMMGGQQPSFGPTDHTKAFQAELDAWKLTHQEGFLDGIEKAALQALSDD